MSLSRRAFVQSLGIGSAGALSTAWITGRDREALTWTPDPFEAVLQASTQQGVIRISSNENARGPGKAALDAMRKVITGDVGRYGREVANTELPAAIASRIGHGLTSENILTSTGSAGILEAGVRAYVSERKPL